MSDRFTDCLYNFTWRPDFDGQGFHVTPGDDGGATNHGFTIATYSGWCVENGFGPATLDDLRHAQLDHLADVARSKFWNSVQGDHLPIGVDLMVFDFGFGAGPSTSARLLQELVGVRVDGGIGPITLHAVSVQDQRILMQRIATRHANFYRGLRTFDLFGAGWLRRNTARLQDAMAAHAAQIAEPAVAADV